MNENKQMADPEMVSRFLDLTSRLSDPERADVLGVTHTTIARWKEGYGKGWKTLQAGTRRKLEDFLANGDTNVNERKRAPFYNEAREEEELARIGGIPSPLLRIMERESIAAVIRAQGVRDACRAARLEAEKAVDRSALLSSDRAAWETAMQGDAAQENGRDDPPPGGSPAKKPKRPDDRPRGGKEPPGQ